MTSQVAEARNWSELDCSLVFEIASRIQLWEDFVSFAGVCTSWRSKLGSECAEQFQHQVQILSADCLAYVSSESIISRRPS